MRICADNRSPNFDAREIPVEFVVIHYTAFSLERTLRHFLDQRSAVSCHLIIGADGSVHELVPCLDGKAFRAWHSGKSRLEFEGKLLEAFNDFSIGIELENFNGNLFPYTDEQYLALGEVLRHLASRYPALANPERIIGHEMIADFRGKADPGSEFDWERVYRGAYPDKGPYPERTPRCPREIKDSLRQLVDFSPPAGDQKDRFWSVVSLLTERVVRAIHEASHREEAPETGDTSSPSEDS